MAEHSSNFRNATLTLFQKQQTCAVKLSGLPQVLKTILQTEAKFNDAGGSTTPLCGLF